MKKILILIGALLILAIASGFLWLYLKEPLLSGKSKLPGLEKEVEVFFDNWGVPHIYANHELDAYRALGYIHAQDRLFQMEMMRRVGKGRLSEILGPDLLEVDQLFRTLCIERNSQKNAAALDPASVYYKTSMAYLEGINYFIDEGFTPIEYTLIGIPKEHFSLTDMYCISGYMAFSFALGTRTDPLVTNILERCGEKYLQDIALDYSPGTCVIPVFYQPGKGISTYKNDFPKIIDKIPLPQFVGSNCWVVGKSKTETGDVLMANDTHIKYGSPSVWYEAHLEYPGYSFYGNHLAGIPYGLVGHTRESAWGITMFENDDMDLYFEKIDESGKNYTNSEKSLELEIIQEAIPVKGEADRNFEIKITHHGPLVDQFLELDSVRPVSIYWSYLHQENKLLEAFYGMSRTKNMEEFGALLDLIGTPGMNISYADKTGNIGQWGCGKLMNRAPGVNGKLILDGSKRENEVQGFLSFDENPKAINPPWNYLYSANNQHDNHEGKYYPGYYTPESRARRIDESLAQNDKWTMHQMKELTLDNISHYERDICQHMCSLVAPFIKEEHREILKRLSSWDGNHDLTSIEPSIYYEWMHRLMFEGMRDEIGDENFYTFQKTHLFKRSYHKMIFQINSVWWDRINTADKEHIVQIALESFEKSLEVLQNKFEGKKWQDWNWGEIHQTLFEHPLGKVSQLAPYFNVGPFPAPGGMETINNASFNWTDTTGILQSTYGPQMRIVHNVSNPDDSWSVLPTGQSGNIMSEHYKDQSDMYMTGGFGPQLMNRTQIEECSTRLQLQP